MRELNLNYMIKRLQLFILFVCIFSNSFAQNISINTIEPPNWWIGMKWNKLQLVIYRKELSDITVESKDRRIEIVEVHKIENSNYAFVDIIIPSEIEEGEYEFIIKNISGKTSFNIYYQCCISCYLCFAMVYG